MLAAAEEARHRRPKPSAYVDGTDIPYVTIDPSGSRDLDQALHIEARAAGGHRVRYAIADPAFCLEPGGAVDAESGLRGETLYCPDKRLPLYPDAIGAGIASLLSGADRPAVVWSIDLDADGNPVDVRVRREVVRSRAQLDYVAAQAGLDSGAEEFQALRDVGARRRERELDRGGLTIRVPEQEVRHTDAGYELVFREPLPVEADNAQLSLLTGLVAARLMLDGGVGLLRTLPAPDAKAIASLRRSALALHIDWPDGASYVDVVRLLDPAHPRHAALLAVATRLFRGAGYQAFDGAPHVVPDHSAIAAPYAHATAPLRRLADRFVSETCIALCAGVEVPDWVRATLRDLPDVMAAADRRANALERAMLDYVEAVLLAPHVGEVFDGVVVSPGTVQLASPAVRAPVSRDAPLGEPVRVRLVRADPAQREVAFSLA